MLTLSTLVSSWLFGSFFISGTLAALVNSTIDDTLGSFSLRYSPQWSLGSGGIPCRTCSAELDSSRAYAGTWHEVTYNAIAEEGPAPIASISFTGSAVYVYCILGPTSTVATDMVFLLDDVQVGSFLRGAIPGDEAWQFDVPVYANASIPNGLHTLAIQSGSNTVNSSIILDYVVYTHESQNDESEKATVIAEAAVVSVGVTLTVVAILYFLFICIHKRRRSRTPAWYSDNEKYQYASNSEYRASKRIVSVTRTLSRFFAQDPARVIIPPSRSSSTRHLVSVLDHPQVVVAKEKYDSLGSSMMSISRPSSPSAYRAGASGGSSTHSSESSSSSASSEKTQISRLHYQNPSNQGSDEVEFPPPIYSSKPDHGQGPLHVVNVPFSN